MQRCQSVRTFENDRPASTRFHRWLPSVVLFFASFFEQTIKVDRILREELGFQLIKHARTHASPHYSCTFKHVFYLKFLSRIERHTLFSTNLLFLSCYSRFFYKRRMSERVPRIIIPRVHDAL